ncbi:helix-turn-helix domain-containing protein [Methylomicrobium sp. Wu6]|uniref:winged helix-turn-helix transcriptional regulator n=1 Tax=Methylomicrobium sp. Wu6 TaxID=3107928 RepID=UPI002DD6557F|nr:helix-turn-helix domain-containing protein [Methylomicrobium sp. Wu6]MEC4748152.1 helix-turn-helix domain-containing protein [Methylomicrobium sp. Wu6]
MNDLNQAQFERSRCPVANVLDVFGDKWTLLVVRDLVLGKSRFGEFSESAEAIPTNILAERLKRLELGGIVTKTPYCRKPLRYQYELTEKGRDLIPVLEAMVVWAGKHVPGTKVFPRYVHSVEGVDPNPFG